MPSCRHFNGYKPCGFAEDCSSQCVHYDAHQGSVLVVHLGALGAVVRSTSLLQGIRLQNPGCDIVWLTDAPADKLLRDHPQISEVHVRGFDAWSRLRVRSWRSIYVIDKSLSATSFVEGFQAEKFFGFQHSESGRGILPVSAASQELFELGLSNQKKFFENKKSEAQLLWEALELGAYHRSEYNLPLAAQEKKLREKRKSEFQKIQNQPVIGLNTGCAPTIPFKKWTVSFHREVIRNLLARGLKNIVLLGGPEDALRNQEIAHEFPVILSPTDKGLRDGLVSIAACDIVLSGDSLGMHMAISQGVFTIAWFGPTCAHEIDLYGRGIHLQAKVACSPCWKRTCSESRMCYDQVSMVEVMDSVEKGIEFCQRQKKSLSFKPPSSEIFS